MTKHSEIKMYVELDENKVPYKIEWEATDAGINGMKESKTLLLSLWDKEEGLTLGIDLWTKEMTVEEMNIHFHQVLIKLSDTYRRATKNQDVADMIEKFSAQFAEKTDLKHKVTKAMH